MVAAEAGVRQIISMYMGGKSSNSKFIYNKYEELNMTEPTEKQKLRTLEFIISSLEEDGVDANAPMLYPVVLMELTMMAAATVAGRCLVPEDQVAAENLRKAASEMKGTSTLAELKKLRDDMLNCK